MKLPELKKLVKEHNIVGTYLMNKPEIIALLVDKGIISEEPTPAVEKREIDPKYEYISHIRTNPKRVEIRDIETDEITISSSLCKASRAKKAPIQTLKRNSGKVWRKNTRFSYANLKKFKF